MKKRHEYAGYKPAAFPCQRGHIHRSADAARVCDVAHRLAAKPQPKDHDTAEFLRAIAAVLDRAANRNRRRGLS